MLCLSAAPLYCVGHFLARVYVTMHGSVNHNFCRITDVPRGIPMGDDLFCVIHFDYALVSIFFAIIAFALWSVIFAGAIIAIWFTLLRFGLVPVLYPVDGSATDWDAKHTRILAAVSFIAAAILYCFVVEVSIGQNTILVWMFDFPSMLLAFPLLASIRYLASRR